MDQLTTCNEKGVAGDNPTENYTDSALPLSSTERFSVWQRQLFVLVLQPAALLFSLSALINRFQQQAAVFSKKLS